MADDYIKRSDALSEIDEWMESVGTALIGKGLSYYAEMQGCIEDCKPADVALVRHAYWVPEDHVDQVSPTTTHRYTWYYCSECGRRLIGYKNPIDAPYCHCGAKMDGKKEKLEKLLHANFREPDVNVRIEYEDSNTERG